MGIQKCNPEIGARILSVLVAFMMIAGATLVVLPGGNEGAAPESPEPLNPAGTDIVISELAAAGNTAYDEFIELYNPTSSAIDISGWTIEYSSETGGWPGTVRATVPADTTMSAKSFYLFANYYTTASSGYVVPASGPTPDYWMDFSGLGNSGGKVRLMNGAVQVDCLGWDAATLCEGSPYPIIWGTPYPAWKSIERKAFTDSLAGSGDTGMEAGGGHEFSGNGFDSDDNSYDFIMRTAREPQNSASPVEGGTDSTPPEFRYAISTSPTAIEVRFNEPVNQADAETLTNWNIVSLTGFDTVPPYIVDCVATSLTSVEVTFSEPVNTVNANNIANYEEVSYSLAITNAALDAELTTVNLTTGTQVVDRTYTLQISNINDTASPPNVIQQYSETTFNGGGGGGTLEIIFMDVEQSDCTIIISPTGQTMLYDGGFTNRGNDILATLTSKGVTHLAYTVASHYHEDHIGGLDEVITGLGGISYVTGACYDRGGSYASTMYEEYVDVVSSKRMTITKGQVLDLGGGVTATCMGVNGNGLTVSDENDKGVVMRVDYQNFQMYLGGDLGGYNDGGYKDVESTVANDVGKVEVYQVDHHGSKYSSNTNFLGVLDPIVSVFSVGTNGYGHVSEEAFSRILSQGSYMYYTNTGSGSVPTAGQGEIV
ncbi:MAG: lamin tail domain-containing protein, partial [Thermoplasmata archaeon]